MEQDRELLELAALACGFKVEGERHAFGYCLYVITPDDGIKAWNPLSDDGDALRLAVKCGVHITMIQYGARCLAKNQGFDLCEQDASDAMGATRRAIVRAAAEIGRRMKEKV